jgi:dTDP-4-amino-4,6-dideoxygalactose transaminase
MKIDFVDLARQFDRIEAGIGDRISQVLTSKNFIQGPEVSQFEFELSEYVGVSYCVGVGNGTDALVIALKSIGVGAGDLVYVPAFTFFATAEAVSLVGAIPVFVDVKSDSFNICVDSLRETHKKIVEQTGGKAKAIIAVDLFGLAAEYSDLTTFAVDNDLHVIEDAAQGIGGGSGNQRIGSFGTIACTSFFPAKPLGCYGDGGAILTDDERLAELARSIQVHGRGANKYDNVRVGMNSRLDTLQAAILLEKMVIFDDELEMRQNNANKYRTALAGCVDFQRVPVNVKSAWAQFSICVPKRDLVVAALEEHEIPFNIYYARPLPFQPAYKFLGYVEGQFPVAESLSQNILSLPFHPYLECEEIEYVADVVKASLC